MSQRVLELLNRIMAGYEISSDELNSLIDDKVKEGQLLDYKHGNELNKGSKPSPRDTIRQYVTGFANADGGILIIGVDAEKKDQPWEVTGASAPGGHDLARWASDCLSDIMPLFSPLPRFQILQHPKGNILVIAALRSANLVPCTESGKIVYYLRIHDKTVAAPDYLLSDLVLGRRQHPLLQLREVQFMSLSKEPIEKSMTLTVCFVAEITIENYGLSWAEAVDVGLIGWVGGIDYRGIPETSSLRSHINIQEPALGLYTGPRHLVHTAHNPVIIRTFESFSFALGGMSWYIPVRQGRDMYKYVWNAALYIVNKNSPPIWYQVSLTIDENTLSVIRPVAFHQTHKEYFSFQEGEIRCTRLFSERPLVGWSDMESYG